MALDVSQITLQFVVPTAGAGTPLALADSPPPGTVNVPYAHCFVASGGVLPYIAFTLTAGALPPGIILNAATGCITGTPTATGTYCFTVTVTDSAAATASVSPCITISGVVLIQLIGWKLYPESPCGEPVEVAEPPHVKFAF